MRSSSMNNINSNINSNKINNNNKNNNNRRQSLDCIFKPKSIAVIGASARVKSVGYTILRNVTTTTTTSGGGFVGRVYAVNPNHLLRCQENGGSTSSKSDDDANGTTKRATILNVPVYATIGDVLAEAAATGGDAGVDLAVIAVRASIVPQIVEQCGQAGVGGLIIVSAGFFEFLNDTSLKEDNNNNHNNHNHNNCEDPQMMPVDAEQSSPITLPNDGSEGSTKNSNNTLAASSSSSSSAIQEIMRMARQYGMRIVGPNSLGVISPGSNLNASFASRMARKGNIAFISQSGALCSSILDWAQEQKVGFSHFVSIGSSMVDVSFPELIDYFGIDTCTTSILIYMESLPSTGARRFMSATRAFARSKPIIILKAGTSEAGTRAALSHTGTLAGNNAAFEAAFQRAGCIRVERISQLFNCAHALGMQPRPKSGNRLAIVTNAGGPGVLCTDRVTARGGQLARLSPEMIAQIDKTINESGDNIGSATKSPVYWSRSNPIDVLEDATPKRYRAVLDACISCDNVDGIIVILTVQGLTDAVGTARELVEVSKKKSHSLNQKPILACFMGESDVYEATRVLEQGKIPNFAFPESAVDVFMYTYQYTRNLEFLYETPPEAPSTFHRNRDKAWHIIRTALVKGRKCLLEHEAKSLLSCYDLPVGTFKVATNEKQVWQFAMELGFPLVMKVLSVDIAHKSDVGGVYLNITSGAEAERVYKEIMERAASHAQTTIDGVLMEKMYHKRYELLFGATKDPIFGPLLVFGQGGAAVEVIRDTNMGLPPLNMALAKRIIQNTQIYKQLKGFRSIPSVDLSDLAFQLQKFSQIVMDFPEIEAIDVNPYLVDEAGGVIADAHMVLGSYQRRERGHPYQHLVISPYPEKYTKTIKAANGQDVVLRAIRPEDEPIESDMLSYSLSAKSLSFRFMGVKPKLTHALLTRFAQIDYDREMAIVAVIEQVDGRQKMIGVARIIADAWVEAAEFAIVVADDWHGQGLGSYMIDYILEVARDKEISKIFATVLRENKHMTEMLQHRGFIFKLDEDDPNVFEAHLELSDSMPFIASDLPFRPD